MNVMIADFWRDMRRRKKSAKTEPKPTRIATNISAAGMPIAGLSGEAFPMNTKAISHKISEAQENISPYHHFAST